MVRKSNKIQYVTVRLKFDQPVTDREAVALFEETISGTFYPKPLARGLGPESFKIGRVISVRADQRMPRTRTVVRQASQSMDEI
jgi:hypothetical protein